MSGFVINQPHLHIGYGGSAVTGEADTELITWTAHGLEVGDAVVFTALTGGTGLDVDRVYYVKTAPDANTLTVAETPGGATAAFSDDITAGTAQLAVDLDEHLVAATLDRPSEAVDVRTFGAPRASDAGGGIDTITLALLWSSELHDALVAHEAEVGYMVFRPDAAAAPTYRATVQYDVAPFGRMSIGTKVEVDLVLGVEDWTGYEAS